MAIKKEKESVVKTVLILSNRVGDIKLPDGQLLTYQKTVRVDEATAEWLLLTFKGYLSRISD
jgi:hypothetical protein